MIFKTIDKTYEVRKPTIFEGKLKYHQSIVGHRKYEINKHKNSISITRRTNSLLDFMWNYNFFHGVIAKGSLSDSKRDLILNLTFQTKGWYKAILMILIFFPLLIIIVGVINSQMHLFLVSLFFSIAAIPFISLNNYCVKKLCRNFSEDLSSIH